VWKGFGGTALTVVLTIAAFQLNEHPGLQTALWVVAGLFALLSVATSPPVAKLAWESAAKQIRPYVAPAAIAEYADYVLELVREGTDLEREAQTVVGLEATESIVARAEWWATDAHSTLRPVLLHNPDLAALWPQPVLLGHGTMGGKRLAEPEEIKDYVTDRVRALVAIHERM
jgi:hypothetical protein